MLSHLLAQRPCRETTYIGWRLSPSVSPCNRRFFECSLSKISRPGPNSRQQQEWSPVRSGGKSGHSCRRWPSKTSASITYSCRQTVVEASPQKLAWGPSAESIGKTAFLGVAWPREAKPPPPRRGWRHRGLRTVVVCCPLPARRIVQWQLLAATTSWPSWPRPDANDNLLAICLRTQYREIRPH